MPLLAHWCCYHVLFHCLFIVSLSCVCIFPTFSPYCTLQVSSQIWEQVIVSLHPDSFKDLSAFIAWLPNDQPNGKAGAAAALLANLAQVSGAALQVTFSRYQTEMLALEYVKSVWTAVAAWPTCHLVHVL